MKPRKSAKSTPAQTPPVQEVDYTIGYENVTVTQAHLNRLKDDQNAAQGMQRYYRFKAWLHYANLKRWQGQGHHFHYLSGPGSIHCTCGLTLYSEGHEADALAIRIRDEVAAKLEHLNLSELQKTLGHKKLPSLRGQSIAITVDYLWMEERNVYLWTVICQRCGAHEVNVLGDAAQAFEDAHNKSCKKEVR